MIGNVKINLKTCEHNKMIKCCYENFKLTF